MGPVLIILAVSGYYDFFKWLLPFSYATDLVDGFLARKYRVATTDGAKMDSYGDDITVAASIVGLFVFKIDFIIEHWIILVLLLALFALQTLLAFKTYKRMTSYHTYLAKLAAILQGTFFILLFLLEFPMMSLFYAACYVTMLELIEEIILVKVIKQWRTNVKGLYWVLKEQRKK
jgi:CDP-diacylglycerol--glycerol-3-phosphate 3-phosphatidyltransferase